MVGVHQQVAGRANDLVRGLAECVQFGMKAGLNMEDVIEVISKGAAGSWQMENRHKTMIAGKFDFGFAVDWMRKDLGTYTGSFTAEVLPHAAWLVKVGEARPLR